MDKPEHITSDVHLGAVPAETERAFVRFLEHVGAEGRRLLIVGDLFDFWFEYGEIIPGRHFRVLAALSDLVDSGVSVLLTGGNHDAWGGRFLEEHVGVEFHPGHFRTELAERPALVAHGDGLGRGDLQYRVLKALIRSRPLVGAFRILHPELGLRIARLASSTKGKTGAGPEPGAVGRARFIEEWARAQLADEPALGWVVCGHAHLPAAVEVTPGRYYLNGGDWLTHWSYLTVGGDGVPSLHRWPGG
jgi:UDP-2,3-diacylglucosamine hydrolase